MYFVESDGFSDGHILRVNMLAHKINACLSLVEYVKDFLWRLY